MVFFFLNCLYNACNGMCTGTTIPNVVCQGAFFLCPVWETSETLYLLALFHWYLAVFSTPAPLLPGGKIRWALGSRSQRWSSTLRQSHDNLAVKFLLRRICSNCGCIAGLEIPTADKDSCRKPSIRPQICPKHLCFPRDMQWENLISIVRIPTHEQ